MKAADENINALRGAKPQICARKTVASSPKNNSAVDGGKPFVSECIDFFAEQVFQSEKTGGDKL